MVGSGLVGANYEELCGPPGRLELEVSLGQVWDGRKPEKKTFFGKSTAMLAQLPVEQPCFPPVNR